MSTITVAVAEIEQTARDALTRHGATPANAIPVARAIARAEAEGNPVCGLYYLPILCDHLQCGKIDGAVTPSVIRDNAVIRVDARLGFAHPAIEAGLPVLAEAAAEMGIASAAITNSYNCLALAHHVLPLAERRLIGICVSNAPASVSPPGATQRLLGTNPLAYAVPMPDGPPILVDQSLSAVTKTAVVLRRQRGQAIPFGWAQDSRGEPTSDPAAGLEGSLLPAGGQKGANLSLLVEILAAALTGSNLSTQASLFGDNHGPPPGVGQMLIAIDPGHFSGASFAAGLNHLAQTYAQAGIRLPGRARQTAETVEVEEQLWRRACALRG